MKRLSLLFFIVLFHCSRLAFSQENSSWKTIQQSKKGVVTAYWFDNNPFSYKEPNGGLKGLEVEILEGFKKFLYDRYQIDLVIRWTQVKSFEDVFEKVKRKTEVGTFGCGGFSITEERKKLIKFTPPYMADIAVLVSTEDIPIVKAKDDFGKYFSDATAITIPGTLQEKDLLKLQQEGRIQFKIKYVANSFDFLSAMVAQKKAFGYVSLPVYLMNLNSGITKIKRQNYFTEVKEGHGIGLPIASDWNVPVNAYFESLDFKQNHEAIIANYINIDLYHFIETFNSDNEVSLLNKEKDIQRMEIKVQEMKIEEESQRQFFLMMIILVVSLLLVVIIFLFRNQLRQHSRLKDQHAEIEAQSDEIKSINDNLELAVKDRTLDLERKNKALQEYAFITAHKLRAPLASILGLVALMERMNLSPEDKVVLEHLKNSSENLDAIIRSVMSAIEEANSATPKKD